MILLQGVMSVWRGRASFEVGDGCVDRQSTFLVLPRPESDIQRKQTEYWSDYRPLCGVSIDRIDADLYRDVELRADMVTVVQTPCSILLVSHGPLFLARSYYL